MRTEKKRPKLGPKALTQAAECLKTLAHPTRILMVQLLLSGRYSVGELAQACRTRQHMASEHLRLMQRCGLLNREREGKNSYYQIAEPQLENLMACIEARFGRKR